MRFMCLLDFYAGYSNRGGPFYLFCSNGQFQQLTKDKFAERMM